MIVAVVAVAIVSVAVCLPGRAVAVALWCRAVAAVAVAPGRRLGCGGRVAFLCRRRVVATRRRMLVFAMVLVVSVLSWFAI